MRHHLLQEARFTEADGLCNSLHCLAAQALTLPCEPTKIRLLLILLTFGPSTLSFCGYISTASARSFLGEKKGWYFCVTSTVQCPCCSWSTELLNNLVCRLKSHWTAQAFIKRLIDLMHHDKHGHNNGVPALAASPGWWMLWALGNKIDGCLSVETGCRAPGPGSPGRACASARSPAPPWRMALQAARPGTCCLVGGRLLVFSCSHLARAPHYVRLPLFICPVFMVSTGVILRVGRCEGIFYKSKAPRGQALRQHFWSLSKGPLNWCSFRGDLMSFPPPRGS